MHGRFAWAWESGYAQVENLSRPRPSPSRVPKAQPRSLLRPRPAPDFPIGGPKPGVKEPIRRTITMKIPNHRRGRGNGRLPGQSRNNYNSSLPRTHSGRWRNPPARVSGPIDPVRPGPRCSGGCALTRPKARTLNFAGWIRAKFARTRIGNSLCKNEWLGDGPARVSRQVGCPKLSRGRGSGLDRPRIYRPENRSRGWRSRPGAR